MVEDYKCICGYSDPDARKVRGHMMAWAKKEPGKHGKAEAQSPVVAEVASESPAVHPNGHTDFLGELNLERRAELEAMLPHCPHCHKPLPQFEKLAQQLEERILAAVGQKPPAHGTGDASVEAELSGPAIPAEVQEERKGIAPGWFLLGAGVAIVAVVVLVILRVNGVIQG
jgi:thiol-disulfide isomerase/thioredoxin